MKKFLLGVMSLVMVFAMTITAFGAELTADEKKIVTALENAGVPTQYVTQASNYLAANDVSAEKVAVIVTEIEAAKAAAGSVTSLKDLTTEQMTTIAGHVSTAAEQLGLKASFDASAKELKITDASGNVILDATAIKNTGADMSMTIAIIAVLAAALVGCGIVVSKKRVSANA